ncbi:MAG: hypothetical protein WC119_00685 [Synergistaceae bacterium]
MKKKFSGAIDLLKSIFNELDGVFANKSVTRNLDKNRNIIISLEYGKTFEYWDRLLVKIVNKLSGEVVHQDFLFVDYLEMEEKHPNIDKLTHLYSPMGEKCIEWYGNAPSDESVNHLISEINKWISLWE